MGWRFESYQVHKVPQRCVTFGFNWNNCVFKGHGGFYLEETGILAEIIFIVRRYSYSQRNEMLNQHFLNYNQRAQKANFVFYTTTLEFAMHTG